MMLKVMAPAKPSNVQWSRVVVMMRIDTFGIANLTRPSFQRAICESGFNSIVRCVNLGWDRPLPPFVTLRARYINSHSFSICSCLICTLAVPGTELTTSALNLVLNGAELKTAQLTNCSYALSLLPTFLDVHKAPLS